MFNYIKLVWNRFWNTDSDTDVPEEAFTVWTDEDLLYVKKNYSRESEHAIAALLGRTTIAVRSKWYKVRNK